MRKIALAIAGLFIGTTVALAAVTSEQRINTDKIVIGRPTPAADPQIEFKQTTQRIKANRTTGRMQFTNDGTNYKNIGSGSGGAGGTNLLQDDNGDFEAGITGWTASGGTFTAETTNPLFGTTSGKWDSSASSQTLQTVLKTIEKGMVGRTCAAELVYKWPSGVAADLSFQVLDGSSNVIFSNDLSPTTGDNVSKSQRNFDCGALGSQYRVRLLSNVSNPAEIIIDNVFLGSDNNAIQISQTNWYGKVTTPGTALCGWGPITSATFQSFSADSDCPVATATGNVSAPSTKIPAVKFSGGPGRYMIIAYGNIRITGSNQTSRGFQFYDGTTAFGTHWINSGGVSTAVGNLIGTIEYTSAFTDKTIEIQAQATSTDSADIVVNDTKYPFTIEVIKYPLNSAEALTLETTGAIISSQFGTDCSHTITSATYADLPGDSTCTFTNIINRGFSPPTPFTNGGNNAGGITFTPPRTGLVLACADYGLTNQAAGNASSVRLTDGTAVIAESSQSANTTELNFNRLCGVYNITSTSSLTLKLQAKVTAPSSVFQQVGTGNMSMKFEVFYLDQQFPAPVFTALQNNVKSAINGERIFRAAIANNGTATITSQSGNWISSVSRTAVGTLTVNFSPGTFSAAPSCHCTVKGNGNVLVCSGQNLANWITSTQFFMATGSGPTGVDADFVLTCVGPQ